MEGLPLEIFNYFLCNSYYFTLVLPSNFEQLLDIHIIYAKLFPKLLNAVLVSFNLFHTFSNLFHISPRIIFESREYSETDKT